MLGEPSSVAICIVTQIGGERDTEATETFISHADWEEEIDSTQEKVADRTRSSEARSTLEMQPVKSASGAPRDTPTTPKKRRILVPIRSSTDS